ncbi:MAG: helix-turn-helix domain-containing protein [Ruminococcus sp.]|nr:helix-turn-helix domain-containing protein [Ruminococcus sp.]
MVDICSTLWYNEQQEGQVLFMTLGDRIKIRRESLGLTQEVLAQMLGYADKSSINKIEKGKTDIRQKRIMEFAAVLKTTPEYLLGLTDDPDGADCHWMFLKDYNNGYPIPAGLRDSIIAEHLKKLNAAKQQTLAEPSNISAVYDDHIRMVPVFESVSAGFGALAENSVVDFIPLRIVSDYEAAETICIRVQGDSMFPKIEDGDLIQVHKQDSVDSGDIAVVLLDGEEGLVKKVIYGPTWIELHSINPMYPVQRFEDADVLRLRVVGKVKRVIKEL